MKCNANNPAKSMANHLNYVTSLDVLEENLTAPVPQVVSGCFAVVYEPGSMPNVRLLGLKINFKKRI